MLLLLSATASAAQAPAVGAPTPWPLKTPAELKKLHGPTFVGMQILTYRREQQPAVDGAAPEVTIGIGRSILFYEDGDDRRIIDLRLARIYDLHRKRYVNSPLAAELDLRDSDLRNRNLQSRPVSAAAGEPDKAGAGPDPFWDATELKVTAPNERAPAIETRQDGGDTVFAYKGQEVMRWRPTDKPLLSSVAGNLSRALLWFWPGHPTLLTKIASGGRAPQRFVVRWRSGGEMRTDDYRLTDSRWCDTCAALPDDAQPGLLTGGFFESDLAPIMTAAVEGKISVVTSEDYLRRIAAALDRDAPLQAYLVFLERALQYDTRRCAPSETGDYCGVINRLFAKMQGDAQIQTFRRNLGVQSVPAAKAIADLRKQAGAYAPYIDLATVNTMPPAAFWFKASDEEPLRAAERLMAAALDGMPMVPAVYRDIGNMYFAAVHPRKAWLTWEMGKAVPGRSSDKNLWLQADKAETQARQRHPDFF
jgi:hypothetical protein